MGLIVTITKIDSTTPHFKVDQKKRISKLSATALLLIIIVVAVGAYALVQPPPSSSGSNTLYIDEPYWPGSLNQLTNPYPNWQMYTVYQPLVTANGSRLQQTGEIQYLPVLSENWSISADQKNIIFNLKDVKFSSGNPLNSYQVWGQFYGLYYLSANSSYWWNGYPVFDMTLCDFGPTTLALMNHSGLINPNADLLSIMQNSSWPIYVIGPHQIGFNIKSPFLWFLGPFFGYASLIFDTQWLLDHGGFGSPEKFNTYFNLNPIPGTGPYVVSTVKDNEFVKFTKNPNYWGKDLTEVQIESNPYIDPGHVQTVIISVRADDIARYTDISTGQASIAGIESVNWPLIIENQDKFGYAVLPPNPGLAIGIAMNTQRYPTNITAVRQAIQHAINLTRVNEIAYFNSLSPWVGPEYPTFKDFYNLGNFSGYEYNVSLSKQILAQANINPAKLPPLEFSILAGVTHALNTAQVIQSDLAQIGITVKINVLPTSQFLSAPPNPGCVSYIAALPVADQCSHLTWFGTATFGMTAVTPVDLLLTSVNGKAAGCNYALYNNPVVQTWINGFFETTDISMLQLLGIQA